MEAVLKKFQELKKDNYSVQSQQVLYLHCINLSHMTCVGLLEDDPENVCELPEHWENPPIYSFKYKKDQVLQII